MKKFYVLVFMMLQYVAIIHSLTITRTKEEFIIKTNNVPVARSSNYISNQDAIIFITIPDAVFMGKGGVDFSRKVYSYNIESKTAREIDVKEGRTKNCISMPAYAIATEDTLFFHDPVNGRVTAMQYYNNELSFQYSFDTSEKMLVSAFNIIDGKMYTCKSTDGSNLSKGLSVFDIAVDTLYAGSRLLLKDNHYIDYFRYRAIMNNGMNEIIRNADEENIFFNTWKESRDTENVYFKNFALKHNGEILVVNSYATDIYRIIDDMEELVDSIKIGLQYRENELKLIKENKYIPRQFDVYSQMQRVFSDESRDFVMMYIQQMKKLRKVTGNDCDYILIKKLGVTEDKSEWMIPIDFIPVYYNEKESTFYGFRKVDGVLNYVEYKLEV